MSLKSPTIKALLALVAAHKELSGVELAEARRALVTAAVCLVIAGFAFFVGWCALNAALVVVFAREPWKALAAVGGAHVLLAATAALKARSALRRPFFELTRREIARDSKQLIELVS